MRIRSFTSIAICALALGLTGCRVQSVRVMPSLTPFFYAAPGQTLEWLPYDPKVTLYVNFIDASPCAQQSYKLGPGPARCKVLKGHNGYFHYYIDTKPGPEPGHDTRLFARSCPYCQIAIDPPPNGTAVSPMAVKSTDSEPYSIGIGCDGKKAVVYDSAVRGGVNDQDTISWFPYNPYTNLKVTTSNMCSGGNNGVFTPDDACTVTGTPGTTSQYTVHLDQCDGSSSLTINKPPPAQ
jgi:hypothetical protein